jgi:lipoprotein-anchoring transpeptidase ErfK/SrfK
MAKPNKNVISGIIALCVVVGLIVFAGKAAKNAHLAKSQPWDKTAIASASALVAQARDFEAAGNLLQAKGLYQQLITGFANISDVGAWQKKMDELNIKLLFSPVITPKSKLYEIKPGDTLTKIARDFKTTIDLLKKANAIADDRIVPGRKIKVWTEPFSIVIDKTQNILMLKCDEEIIKTYVVATGVNNSTPIGTFTITKKITNPTWFKSGAVIAPGTPENLLGTRWLGFDLAGYGIHGTNDPQLLGRQVTQGCVRLSNPDIEELYAIIPEGTEVTIVD